MAYAKKNCIYQDGTVIVVAGGETCPPTAPNTAPLIDEATINTEITVTTTDPLKPVLTLGGILFLWSLFKKKPRK